MNHTHALLLLMVAFSLPAAPLVVQNRPPAVGEIGYLPPDGSTAELNPPSMAWLHERAASNYELQLSTSEDFAGGISVTNLNFNCHTPDAALQPGRYWWRYRFSDRNGQTSSWSTVRSFKVTGEAPHFPMPSKQERLERVPKGHPRLFVRPEDLPRLREAARHGSTAKSFDALKQQADKLLGRKLVPEPKEPGTATVKTNVALLQNWWANRVQTLKACEEAETVAFVYLVTGEKSYGNEARRRILDIASWDPAAETNFRRNCEAAKPLLHRLSRACDWAWDTLSAEDLAKVKSVLRVRLQDAWESGEVGRGTGHINQPLNSHGNRTWHKIGESGIVFLGEMPEAELWLDYALNKFYACYPVWSDGEGGWHEGLSYWGGYMSKAVWWLHASRVALGIDGLQKPFFGHVGDFALYMAPPGVNSMGFGDLSGRAPSTSWGGFLEYYLRNGSSLRNSQAGYWRWWAQQWKMTDQDGILGFLYQATQPPLPQPRAPTDLPVSKVFHGIGVASLHTTLLNATQDVHFLLKSSPFGSMSHGHNAQNGFQLTAYGDTLLPACVYRDWHGTKFHNDWVQQTISQNAVLVNGRGQVAHSGAARGRIAASEFHAGWDYVVGDATDAYGGRLKRGLRHAIFVKPDLIILCDELAAVEPSTFELMLHALSEFEVNAAEQTLHVQLPQSGLTVHYLAPKPLQLKQWDGFDPKPMKEGFANHWHVQAGTTDRVPEGTLITLLAPHRGTKRPELSARRIETATSVGVQVSLDGKTVRAAIRKAGVHGPAEWDGVKFTNDVFVEAK